MIEMQHVTKRYDAHLALDDLNLTVPTGAVYGLVGPNGAGKSTAIRLLTGILRPTEGTITVDGQPVYDNNDVKQRIGYIPDDIFHFPSANMGDMAKFYRGIYKSFDETLYRKLFEAFQLPERTPLRQFSKGMLKQAAFHLSLAIRPEVMVLDEPVDGLDPVMRRQVWSLMLDQVAQHGTTVLVSSHNLRELEDVCDHVGIMDKGKMLLERSLEQMQGTVMKVQLVGDMPQGLELLHETQSGRLKTLIVRGDEESVRGKVAASEPVYFDILPLSLEEIFIYELGGVQYEVKNIVL